MFWKPLCDLCVLCGEILLFGLPTEPDRRERPEECRESEEGRDRLERVFLAVNAFLGTTEVRHEHHFRARIERKVHGGQRCANALLATLPWRLRPRRGGHVLRRPMTRDGRGEQKGERGSSHAR